MSPALAFGWYIWTRHRRGLSLLGIYWLTAMIVCRAVPDGAFVLGDGKSISYAKVAFAIFCPGAVVAFGYLLLIFSFSREVRLEACASSFPARLRTLPLPTRSLAGWLMLWGSATMMLGWLMLAWATRRPQGFDVPFWWPSLMLAVILAWMQAIVWTPFPLPWVRVLLLIPVSSLLVGTPLAILKLGTPPMVVCAVLVALLSAAYWSALRGVARARRGEERRWVWPAWLRWRGTATPTRRPFASAARAQLWLEWRRNGLAFPVTVVVCSLFLFPAVVSPWLLDNGDSWLALASVLFFLMLLLASACGVVIGNLPGREGIRSLSPFLATRPLSVGSLIRAKFEVAALSTLAGWAVLGSELLLLLLWGVLCGHSVTMRQHQSAGRFWASLVLLMGSALVLAWAQMAGHLWMGLTRRVSWMTNCILGSPATLVLIVAGLRAMQTSELRHRLADLLPWLASGALVLKCLAAAWSLSRLKRNALVPPHVLIGAPLAWCTVAIGLLAVLRWLIPSNVVPVSGLVLSIVLLLPLTRLALAPLVLAWNRHR